MTRKQEPPVWQLSDEEKKALTSAIEAFYLETRDEKIGMIAARETLDFFLDVLGKKIYNKGLDDALRFFKQTQENAEADYFSLYKTER